MHTAFFKHALRAGLSAVSLGCGPPAATGGRCVAGRLAERRPRLDRRLGSGGAPPAPAVPGKSTLATWFGPGFYGHSTACGQKMSPTLVGVASRTLACGTLVQIGYRGQL